MVGGHKRPAASDEPAAPAAKRTPEPLQADNVNPDILTSIPAHGPPPDWNSAVAPPATTAAGEDVDDMFADNFALSQADLSLARPALVVTTQQSSVDDEGYYSTWQPGIQLPEHCIIRGPRVL